MTASPGQKRVARLRAERRELEAVKPLELFFDTVFVLGFTQCTALMTANPGWQGIAHGILVLGVLWWAWGGFAWLTSVIDPEEGVVRIAMFAAMAALLVVALCVPESFGARALGFAIAYGVVRAAHIALYLLASRDDADLRRSVVGLGVSSAVAVSLLVGGAFAGGAARETLWVAAIVADFVGPIGKRMAGWRLAPAHFAERHNLVIILALGESVVALGVAADIDLTAGVVVAAVLGIGLASALWWTYFDVVALVTGQRLLNAASGIARNRLARDSYSYLHFPMVAGIVLGAFGLHETLPHVFDAPAAPHAFGLLGGTAVYLLAHVALRLRNAHSVNRQRLVLALVFLALIPVATEVPALATLAAVNVAVWAMIAFETVRYGETRYQLRHGLAVDRPPPGIPSARPESDGSG